MLLNLFLMGSDNHELYHYKKYYLWNYLSMFHHHQSEHLHKTLIQVDRREPKLFQVHQKAKSPHVLREGKKKILDDQ